MGTILGLLGTKLGFFAILLTICLVAVWGISRHWHPAKPPRVVTNEYAVVSVPSANSILVEGRFKRKNLVTLAEVETPEQSSPLFEAARANLERLAGATIRVEHERRRLLASEAASEPLEATAAPEAIEARGPLTGTVYGQSGACLQLSQLEAGFARCLPDAPKEWHKAESEAKKAKRGIWGK